jgi:hypothetical protein
MVDGRRDQPHRLCRPASDRQGAAATDIQGNRLISLEGLKFDETGQNVYDSAILV